LDQGSLAAGEKLLQIQHEYEPWMADQVGGGSMKQRVRELAKEIIASRR